MRVLILSDMEGVSGIVVWNQVNGGDPMFEEARRLYTEEINAAVRGARRAGAKEIVAVDCHGAGGGWTFNSFVPELLDPDCEWVAHHAWSRYTEMLESGMRAFWSECTLGPALPTACCATRSARPIGGGFGLTTTRLERSASTPRLAARSAFRFCS